MRRMVKDTVRNSKLTPGICQRTSKADPFTAAVMFTLYFSLIPNNIHLLGIELHNESWLPVCVDSLGTLQTCLLPVGPHLQHKGEGGGHGHVLGVP